MVMNGEPVSSTPRTVVPPMRYSTTYVPARSRRIGMRIARADDPVASEENAAAEETRVARALASCAPSASEASTATLSAKDAPGRVASALATETLARKARRVRIAWCSTSSTSAWSSPRRAATATRGRPSTRAARARERRARGETPAPASRNVSPCARRVCVGAHTYRHKRFSPVVNCPTEVQRRFPRHQRDDARRRCRVPFDADPRPPRVPDRLSRRGEDHDDARGDRGSRKGGGRADT